jgi:replicative DNA helicase
MPNGTATDYEKFKDSALRKVPPQDLETESSVLGAVLLEPPCLNDVMALLKAEDFYLEGHRRIFRAFLEMSERNQPIDTITLGDYLKTKNELEAVGGSAYLCTLAEFVPTAVNVLSYAKIVKRQSQLRSLISLFMESAERGYTGNDDPLLLASDVCAELLRINPTSRPHVSRIGDLMTACLKDLDNAYQSKGRIIGVPTGLEELERYYGGISKDDLIVVGGRTSQGKTALAGTIAKNAAVRGYSVAFVSAESDPKKIAMRLLSQASQVENVRLQVGVLAESDFPKS